jgi:hypothetical protein
LKAGRVATCSSALRGTCLPRSAILRATPSIAAPAIPWRNTGSRAASPSVSRPTIAQAGASMADPKRTGRCPPSSDGIGPPCGPAVGWVRGHRAMPDTIPSRLRPPQRAGSGGARRIPTDAWHTRGSFGGGLGGVARCGPPIRSPPSAWTRQSRSAATVWIS